MPFIGLTGGFGMGKTTALKIFKSLGAYTIDADGLVHDILKKPTIIKKLSFLLGEDILIKKGTKIFINKKHMADIIFNDPQKRKAVEKILHPEVIKSAANIKKKIEGKYPEGVIVFEIPLLFEAGYRRLFDKIIVVYCRKTIAIERLKKCGFSTEQILKRMQAQIPISKKKSQADFLIDNNFGMNNIRLQVKQVFKELKQP